MSPTDFLSPLFAGKTFSRQLVCVVAKSSGGGTILRKFAKVKLSISRTDLDAWIMKIFPSDRWLKYFSVNLLHHVQHWLIHVVLLRCLIQIFQKRDPFSQNVTHALDSALDNLFGLAGNICEVTRCETSESHYFSAVSNSFQVVSWSSISYARTRTYSY